MNREELRFINNLSILLECGRPLLSCFRNLQAATDDEACKAAYTAMIAATESGNDFTTVLGDYPQLCSRSTLALLQAGRRSSCLGVLLPKLAHLVRSTVEGHWEPRRRFFETWALMVEAGIPLEEGLGELNHDFRRGPLREVAEGLRATVAAGGSLSDGAKKFPEFFDAVSIDLLEYGHARDLARALRAITRLI
ncbi:MAG: type II secretion system F family protein [Planctomycetes bacterium]|nr:type II secretion system F family protein [Planctomycetota bacterium]